MGCLVSKGTTSITLVEVKLKPWDTLTHTHTQFNFCVFIVCLFLHVFTHSLKTAKIITPLSECNVCFVNHRAPSFSLLHRGCTKQVFLRGSSFGTASLKLLSGRKIQAVKTPVEWMRWKQRLDYGNNSELFMNSLVARTLDVFRARPNRAVRWCRMAVEAVTGEDGDGDERTAKRCRGGREGGWHPRTNKYLFRILHGTPLQRVWFPGSAALLMHPSTPVLPPPELRN